MVFIVFEIRHNRVQFIVVSIAPIRGLDSLSNRISRFGDGDGERDGDVNGDGDGDGESDGHYDGDSDSDGDDDGDGVPYINGDRWPDLYPYWKLRTSSYWAIFCIVTASLSVA